ncbi:MAG: hypothetical protein CVU50_02475 [Candidatus Cloacimonetes bacterium HGW-Cloacimonetes-3]|nr:MAG: hypothetical protein CVU50_02475 [Candidatus Cloacimonetes bacterium HGW-Cloacimonetes-3]
MKLNKTGICLSLLLILLVSSAHARMAVPSTGTKKLDLSKFHNVGNIWLRVSNYGFFGSGDDVIPQYPSLEYPGGSGTDYLYQGALWFGAKKQRRDIQGKKMYWPVYPPTATTVAISEDSPLWNNTMTAVLDTLVTVGFDGDADLYEFLPAYNPLLVSNPDLTAAYDIYNPLDGVAYASTRFHRRGVDDDGDGKVDEDFVGYTFPLRQSNELPEEFVDFGGSFLHNLSANVFGQLNDPANLEIWFPLGFQELAFDNFPLQYPLDTPLNYAFTNPRDDDGDGRIDEDGAPVSEQDFIAYYYDYCPFGSEGERDHGSSKTSSTHIPLDVRVRQMSYQWSFEYIKNLVYIEFNITNMHKEDTLVDCAMGIYMDADVGPQTWGAEKAADDKSGYVKGSGFEFAYTFDADFDGGLSPGYVGARVCTPDPEKLKFHCWYWVVGKGPNDEDPLDRATTNKTANEKYWLLTGRNPNNDNYKALRPELDSETEYVQPSANDTRFLFAFYGNPTGSDAAIANPETVWNLEPGKTMKIVVAVFPGDTLPELKRSAAWAKEIYGQAQDLLSVVKPDIFTHYDPPEPPEIPKLYAEIAEDGDFRIDLYWDNRSEFYQDVKTVPSAVIGWQFPETPRVSGLDSDPNLYLPSWDGIPEEFRPDETLPLERRYNNQALVNPYTAYRLRHDFQGYTIWGRSGSGSREDWEMVNRWDKIETQQDKDDYNVNNNFPADYRNFGGYRGIDTDLPNKNAWANTSEYTDFYHYTDKYDLEQLTATDHFYGYPIYDPVKDYNDPVLIAAANNIDTAYPGADQFQYRQMLKARLFKHSSIRTAVFDELYDAKLIPLNGMGFAVGVTPTDSEVDLLKRQRLARRCYRSSILYPRKGVEYYVAVTAYDRGIPSVDLDYLESGRDADANMKVFFPGSVAKEKMDNIMVIPNPYIGRSKFDGRLENDEKGDKSRRLWFVNLPTSCTIRIYTLAGDLVKELDHEGATQTDIITISKASPYKGMSASGMHSWNLLSKNNQIIAPGVYLFSVENKTDSKIKVGKFVVVK